jgi:hypothetical protein
VGVPSLDMAEQLVVFIYAEFGRVVYCAIGTVSCAIISIDGWVSHWKQAFLVLCCVEAISALDVG